MNLGPSMFGSPEVTLLVLSGFVLWVIMGFYNPRLLAILAFLLYAAQMGNPNVLPQLGTAYGVIALGIALLAAALRGRMPRFEVLRSGVFPAAIAYVCVGTFTLFGSVDIAASLETLMSCVFAVVFVWILISAMDAEEIRSGIRWSMGILCIVSLVAVVGNLDFARHGLANRWRGVTENANSLATMSAFYLLSARTVRGMKLGMLVTVAILLGTATRSAALGIVVVAGPQFLRNRSITLRRAVTLLTVVAVVPLLYSVFFTEGSETINAADGSITRLSNSRSESWGDAISSIIDRPVTGVGAGNDRSISEHNLTAHSSLLRPLVEVGVVAVLPLALVIGAAVRSARAGPSQFRAIFAFMLVLGVFEGWLFAGGSIFFVFFLFSAYYALNPEPSEVDEFLSEPRPAPDPRVGVTSGFPAPEGGARPGFAGAETAGGPDFA